MTEEGQAFLERFLAEGRKHAKTDAEMEQYWAQRRAEESAKVWDALPNPPIFKDNDAARLRDRIGEDAYAKLRGWSGAGGLALQSTSSGVGKTRAASQVIRRLVLRDHRRVLAKRAVIVGVELARAVRMNEGEHYMGSMESADVLFIDDFGKEADEGRSGKEARRLMLAVLDSRMSQNKTTILTFRMSMAKLQELYGDYGPDIARRIDDFFLVVNPAEKGRVTA